MAHASVDTAVALVLGAGEGLGRELALRLAAVGVKVVVGGADERAVACVVGEITCGGGVARHIAVDTSQSADLQAAVKKAVETFGSLTFIVALCSDRAEIAEVLATLSPRVADPRHLLAITAETGAHARIKTFAQALALGSLVADALDLQPE